jgi:hypothetical protein
VVGGYAARHDARRRPADRQSVSCCGLKPDARAQSRAWTH